MTKGQKFRRVLFSRYGVLALISIGLIPVLMTLLPEGKGDGVTPAYTDRKGKVKFLRRRGIDQIWKDSTYTGTIWVWFSDDKTCLGISPSKFEWSDDYQMVTDLVN